MDYFFYGTLLDRDLLARVVGRRVPDARIESATLEGYRRLRMTGTPYPMLARESGGRVDGILVKGLGQTAARRLSNYEGHRYTIRFGRTTRPGIRPSREPWNFER